MKKLKQNYNGFLAVAAVSVTFILAGTGQSFADNWRYDHDGYWDNHHHHHAFEYYHNQRGYWDERNGVRIWINI